MELDQESERGKKERKENERKMVLSSIHMNLLFSPNQTINGRDIFIYFFILFFPFPFVPKKKKKKNP